MTLVFCCPTCGATLRVPAATRSSAIRCPQCGDAIRVPHAPHPVETGEDVSVVPTSALTRARKGSRYLSSSLWVFLFGAACLLASATLRLSLAGTWSDAPDWAPQLVLILILLWTLSGIVGGILRAVGYAHFRHAFQSLSLEPWCRASILGAILASIGITCAIPRIVGPQMSMVVASILLIGMTCGMLGIVMEFAFLPALHRLLSDTSGWRGAARTNAYAVSFVFAVVSAMAILGGGLVVTVLAYGGKANQVGAIQSPPAEVRFAVLFTLSGLTAIVGLTCYRYASLLAHTRQALAVPEPYPGSTVPHAEPG